MRLEDPAGYRKMMASFVPKELEVIATAVAELSDDELGQMIERYREQRRRSQAPR